jgi:hypothetical protein
MNIAARRQTKSANITRQDAEYSWPPSQSFWLTEFVTKTQNGTKPYLFKSILPRTVHDPLQVTIGFKDMQSPTLREITGSRIRVYVEEERTDDLAKRALNTQFLADETLLSFMQRVTEAERFSLVLNNFERVSPSLAANLGDFLHSMFVARGIPIGGCEQVVFAGNYSGTAFGVHEGFEHAFLCHLGPGNKDFYCWPQETYLQMTGGRRDPSFGDYLWMLERGERFLMEPGDVLYLPALVYHVGRQTNFSVAVAIPIYTFPRERFFTRVVVPGLSAEMPFDKEGMSQHLEYSSRPDALIAMLSPTAEETFAKWTSRDLDAVLRYRWYRLVSNGVWELPDTYTYAPFDEPDLREAKDHKNGDKVRLLHPYRLYWEKELNCASNELRVFARGRSVVIPDSEEITALFERLNRGGTIELTNAPAASAFSILSRTEAIVSDH